MIKMIFFIIASLSFGALSGIIRSITIYNEGVVRIFDWQMNQFLVIHFFLLTMVFCFGEPGGGVTWFLVLVLVGYFVPSLIAVILRLSRKKKLYFSIGAPTKGTH